MLRFVRDNAPWLTAATLMTLTSSFGQTFFISVFAGEIRAEFDLSHGAWGRAYTIGTLASAATMMALGPITDRVRVGKLAAIVMVGLSCFCLAMAAAPGAWALPFLIWGLRFFGQGMLSQLPAVAIGRWFRANRGRAIAVAFLGVSGGQAIFPFLFVSIMAAADWRIAWAIAAILPLLATVPTLTLLRRERSPQSHAEAMDGAGIHGHHWTRGQALRHWLFWMTFPGFLAQPIFSTAMVFHQVHLTEVKGWSLAAFAALFPIMMIAKVFGVMCSGWSIDRFGVVWVMPLMSVPAALGYLFLAEASGLEGAAVGLLMIGLSTAIISTVHGAFWPDAYGTRNLGALRSMATAVMVFASAVGPGATGYLIDLGVDFRDQLLGMAALSIAACVTSGFAMWRLAPLLPTRAPG
jgi:MFS family permease